MRILITGLLLTVAVKAFGQETGGNGNLYWKSLVSHLEYVKTLDQDTEKPIRHIATHGLPPQTVFVRAVTGITDGLPASWQGFRIEYLSFPEIRSKAKKGGFYIIEISPVRLFDNKLKITITDQTVQLKGRKDFQYMITGGSDFIYHFDCEEGMYKLLEKTHGGV